MNVDGIPRLLLSHSAPRASCSWLAEGFSFIASGSLSQVISFQYSGEKSYHK